VSTFCIPEGRGEEGPSRPLLVKNENVSLSRFDEWVAQQVKVRQNVRSVLKHLHKRGTPPPKVWWVPPTGIRSVLRLALR